MNWLEMIPERCEGGCRDCHIWIWNQDMLSWECWNHILHAAISHENDYSPEEIYQIIDRQDLGVRQWIWFCQDYYKAKKRHF